MNMNMTMTMVMQTTFYSDTSFEFLFDDWEVTNSSTYFGALAGLFFLSMVLSLLNFGLSHIEAQMVKAQGFRNKIGFVLFLAAIRFLFISLSYILMLAVMTYNTGVFVTISLGISIGYLFTPTLHNDPLPPSKPEEVQAYEFR